MQNIAIGQPVPSLTLPDLQGRLHILSDYLGQIVILNFWSATCPHSERVDRSLLHFLSEWGKRVAVLWIACEASEPVSSLSAIARQRGLPVVLHDAEQIAVQRFGAQVTPHLFVIDASGILRYRGAFDDVSLSRREPSRCYLKEAVEALLGGSAPNPAEISPFGCVITRQ